MFVVPFWVLGTPPKERVNQNQEEQVDASSRDGHKGNERRKSDEGSGVDIGRVSRWQAPPKWVKVGAVMAVREPAIAEAGGEEEIGVPRWGAANELVLK
ncbi:unnamed protein product [Clonostachys rhizophaga]|uniref:Uncharacterized protein n=1 Tax=Clonostachys rhizophaga TaxID=160324 RepID=A0A9N9VQ65_9HYPO|nr:unnamed protein product [Clonostachys rhizophaga]